MYVSIYFPRQRFLSPQGVTQTQILRKPPTSLRNICTPQAKLWFPNETYENHKQTIGFIAKRMKTTRKRRFSYTTNEKPSNSKKQTKKYYKASKNSKNSKNKHFVPARPITLYKIINFTVFTVFWRFLLFFYCFLLFFTVSWRFLVGLYGKHMFSCGFHRFRHEINNFLKVFMGSAGRPWCCFWFVRKSMQLHINDLMKWLQWCSIRCQTWSLWT